MEIEELKKQSKVFRTRFQMLIEAQLDLLKTTTGIICLNTK